VPTPTPHSAPKNASATAGLPNTIQAQMPNGRLSGQAGDHGIIATIAAVAASGYQRSCSILMPPLMSTPDTVMISTPRFTIANQMPGIGSCDLCYLCNLVRFLRA
jgi:hypothetical protein